MKQEIEAKFYPVEPEVFRRKLEGLGARLQIPRRLMKRVLFDNRFNPKLQGSYLRVRNEGRKTFLTLKVHALPGGKVSDQKESQVEVSDFETTVEILKLSGLKPSDYQETFREEWELEGAEVSIDWWPGLEPFVEIEADSEEKLKRLAKQIGFNWEKKVVASTSYLYEKVFGLNLKEVLGLINDLTFQKNPFEKRERKRPDFFQLPA